ncbi:hypothetical protein SAMN05216551_11582 [Chitinasiproducens palmae]|uniref:Uncharacterized protein n=1 Tax=Chitinasiproducens palmae TaxID=1770053 RepID=A0A1H2PV58_9BURK|nr:hypothetical protein SAMN05216551_11582 [Chitinasiproducens palmae]
MARTLSRNGTRRVPGAKGCAAPAATMVWGERTIRITMGAAMILALLIAMAVVLALAPMWAAAVATAPRPRM